MESLINAAVTSVENYRKNKIIMKFVTDEALEKVASEIREAYNGGTTAKAVGILSIKHKNIAGRVDDYINAGLLGCYVAAVKKGVA